MKVKELRTWLNDMSEKQKEHRDKSQGRRRSLASTDDLSLKHHHQQQQQDLDSQRTHSDPGAKPNLSRVDVSPGAEKVQLRVVSPKNALKAKLLHDYTKGIPNNTKYPSSNHHDMVTPKGILKSSNLDELSLFLKQNPSADPTVATRDESFASASVLSDIIPKQTSSWETSTLVNIRSWDDFNFPDPADQTFEIRPASSFDASIDSVLGRVGRGKKSERPEDHVYANETDSPIDGHEDFGQLHLSLIQKHSSLEEKKSEESDDIMSEASDVVEPTMTMHAANIFGNKTLTNDTLEFICSEGKVKRSEVQTNLTPDLLADDETSSSLSRDSSLKPSIAPDALNSKMTQLFLDSHPLNNGIQHPVPSKAAPRTIPRCKKIDPKDLEFLRGKGQVPSTIGQHEQRVTSSVAKGIQKFGGNPKSIVEQRKDELEKIWSQSKQVVHVRKVKWGVCQQTGTYKKKVIIDVKK